MVVENFDFLVTAADLRYSRKTGPVVEVESEMNEAHARPLWLRRVAGFLIETETARILQKREEIGDSNFDPAGQLENKLGVLSRSVIFHSEGDVDVFEKFLFSMRRFWKGFGAISKSRFPTEKTDGELFTDEVDTWLSWGISSKTIAGWFDSAAGAACMDPTLTPQFFSPGSDVGPLAGIKYNLRDEGIRGEQKGTQPYEVVMAEIEKIVALRGNEARTGMEGFKLFARGVAASLRVKITEAVDGFRREKYVQILEKVDRCADFLDLMAMEGYKEIDVLRPSGPDVLLKPLAFALSEVSLKEVDDQQLMASGIATDLVAAISRRRIPPNRASLLALCASFTRRQNLRMGELDRISAGSGRLAGIGLELLESFLLDQKTPDRLKSLRFVSDTLIPEFIFQLRTTEMSTFKWQKEDYLALGLSEEIWRKHNTKISETPSSRSQEREMVQNGNLVLEFSGQFGPMTTAHLALAAEMAGLDPSHLILSGLLPRGFEGRINIGFRVNSRNPQKTGHRGTSEERWRMVKRSVRFLPSAFIYPLTDVDRSTPNRLKAHEDWFRTNERTVTGIIPVRGTDHLGGSGGYEGRDLELNHFPHIFTLQLEEQKDFLGLPDRMRAIFRNFRNSGAMILLVPFHDVHSSYFRNQIGGTIDLDTLSTLVPPVVMREVIQIWGQKPEGSPVI